MAKGWSWCDQQKVDFVRPALGQCGVDLQSSLLKTGLGPVYISTVHGLKDGGID